VSVSGAMGRRRRVGGWMGVGGGMGGCSEPRCLRFVHLCRQANKYCEDGEVGVVKTVVDFGTQEHCEMMAGEPNVYRGLQCCSTHGCVRVVSSLRALACSPHHITSTQIARDAKAHCGCTTQADQH
jgi:hypothetical protein